MTEENPVWDRGLEERAARQGHRKAAGGPAQAEGRPTVSPQWPSGAAGAAGAAAVAAAGADGVSAAERADLWAPTREEQAEARRLVLDAMSRDKGGGLLVAAAVILLGAGTSLIWVGTREPEPEEAAPVRPASLESPAVVSLQPPEFETASAPAEKPETGGTGRKLDMDDLDFGPEPVPDDFFEGPEPEI